jgi:hypothetical protein
MFQYSWRPGGPRLQHATTAAKTQRVWPHWQCPTTNTTTTTVLLTVCYGRVVAQGAYLLAVHQKGRSCIARPRGPTCWLFIRRAAAVLLARAAVHMTMICRHHGKFAATEQAENCSMQAHTHQRSKATDQTTAWQGSCHQTLCLVTHQACT